MVSEICHTFENGYDKNNLTLKLPDIFSQMVNKDADIELVTSNTLQPMNMILSHNIMTDSVAYIFVNTECKGIEYPNANEKGNTAYKLFREVFGFQDVCSFTNLSRSQIIGKLMELKKKSVDFEKKVEVQRINYEKKKGSIDA